MPLTHERALGYAHDTCPTSAPSFARSLVEANARFVVVGGLAVVVRGYARLTADVDLVVDLSAGEAVKVVAALERIGLVPRAHELFGQRVLVASLEDLIAMKRLAGRPKDLDDIRALEAIQRGRTS